MIMIAGRMTMAPEAMETFAQDVAAMVDRVRAEDGCHYYSLLVEDQSKGWVNVSEMWRDEAALGVHFTQPWIADFFGKYGSLMTDSTMKIYDLVNERDLPG